MKIIEMSAGKKLFLVFDGFGGSPERSKSIVFVPKEYAVWYVYDYTDDSFPLKSLKSFDEVHLAAWSLGVWQAAETLGKTKLDSAAAFNGTLEPLNEEFGIAPKIFDATVENWSISARLKFNRRCKIPGEFTSSRPIEEEKDELVMLKSRIERKVRAENIYKFAFAGAEDKIFPLANQSKAWSREIVDFVETDAPHYIWNRVEERKLWTKN